MQARWSRDDRVGAEAYFALHPHLLDDADAALGLVYEELCLREARGEPPPLADLVRRFPQWAEPLARLVECRELLALGPGEPQLPAIGDTLGAYRLVAELGRGKQGTVFLATEPQLANRPLVLKITANSGREHLSLARLQHTHIVPLYFAEDEPRLGLRILGMPFFGGGSLERFLKCQSAQTRAVRRGKDFADWLAAENRAIPLQFAISAKGLTRLESLSYSSVVCWIGVCIAEALHYAHEKGLVHLDLKPSNVLLTADGEPMLLDFHLAREPIRAHQAPPLWLGGTTRYMSPEQAAAFAAISRQESIACDVDERSDVYSLGLLLFELLASDDFEEAARAHGFNTIARLASPGLADLIARCLAADPGRRYQTAGELAADLRRHLMHQPLLGVPTRSLSERWRKWRRRAPYALRNWALSLSLVATLAVATGLSWRHVRDVRGEAQAALEEGRARLAEGHFELAQRALERGLHIAASAPGGGLTAEFRRELDHAAAAQRVQALHGLMDELRNLFGMTPLPAREAAIVLPRCRAVWLKRNDLLNRPEAQLSHADRETLVHDLVELAVLWSHLTTRMAGANGPTDERAKATVVLNEAAALAGGSPVVAYEQARLSEAAALPDLPAILDVLARQPAARRWRESYALGLVLLSDSRLEAAGQCLSVAVQIQPNSLWAQYHYGRCRFEQQDFAEAARALSACIALAPQRASAYFSRGVVFEALDDPDRALADYTAALNIDPQSAAAALNRGILHYKRRDYQQAERDLEHALTLGGDPVAANYNLALVEFALGKRTAAAARVTAVLARSPRHSGALQLSKSLSTTP